MLLQTELSLGYAERQSERKSPGQPARRQARPQPPCVPGGSGRVLERLHDGRRMRQRPQWLGGPGEPLGDLLVQRAVIIERDKYESERIVGIQAQRVLDAIEA